MINALLLVSGLGSLAAFVALGQAHRRLARQSRYIAYLSKRNIELKRGK